MSPITATPRTGRGGAGARRGSRGRVCGAARAGPGRLQLCHRSVEWARYDRNLARCKKNLQRAAHRSATRLERGQLAHCAFARPSSVRGRGIRGAARCARSGIDGAFELQSRRGYRRALRCVLREQGVNSHLEAAYAFDCAGFAAYDVTMSDLLAGRASLADFSGFVASGGFSYGDVLGAGRGWAKTIQFNAQLAEMFSAFFGRGDTFALGICNGCQMMSALQGMIPGAQAWPEFSRNLSEQFEARLALVEVTESPSLFFDGMAGSRLPVAVAHGEGRADFSRQGNRETVHVVLRYIDPYGAPTERYPFNPNGSPAGMTAVTTPDGRFTILMPHPERVFRTVQMSWHPPEWGAESPWLRMFCNARRWLG